MEESQRNTAAEAPARVCILTGGRGSRMGMDFPFNKALLPLGEKAVITRIIEKFPAGTRFVIGLGHCAEQVRAFLAGAHPTLNVELVEVRKLEGTGSGPGRSLLECAPHLQDPFYFVACDTLWEEPLPGEESSSWVGIPSIPPPDRSPYCNVVSSAGRVLAFEEKRPDPRAGAEPFIGLAFIREPGLFFQGLRLARPEGELQVSAGLSALIPAGLVAKKLSWVDLGTREKLAAAAACHEAFNFNKANEFLFFSRNRVMKFFRDGSVAERRVRRAALNPGVFPPIRFHQGQFYAYDFVPGRTLYEGFSLASFLQLLRWLEAELWREPGSNAPEFAESCRRFYLDKTEERIAQWERKYPDLTEPETVNGTPRPALRNLLSRLPVNELCAGVPRFIHGDLQPDNILVTPRGFVLLDWRQDFAGLLDQGDLYYDFAKLRGGLLVNYRLIKEGKWSCADGERDCSFTLPALPGGEEALFELDRFALSLGLSERKVRLITGLIFANMAPLHHPPFDRLLWNLAREQLAQELAPAEEGSFSAEAPGAVSP